MKSNKTLGRLFFIRKKFPESFLTDKSNINSPIKYSVCGAGTVVFRPKQSNISIKNTIINYIHYRNFRCNTDNPCEEFDTIDTSNFNRPINKHIYGFGGYWTMYGFDEKLFKHTIYPHFIKNSDVYTLFWTYNKNKLLKLEDKHSSKIDYFFMKHFNNNINSWLLFDDISYL